MSYQPLDWTATGSHAHSTTGGVEGSSFASVSLQSQVMSGGYDINNDHASRIPEIENICQADGEAPIWRGRGSPSVKIVFIWMIVFYILCPLLYHLALGPANDWALLLAPFATFCALSILMTTIFFLYQFGATWYIAVTPTRVHICRADSCTRNKWKIQTCHINDIIEMVTDITGAQGCQSSNFFTIYTNTGSRGTSRLPTSMAIDIKDMNTVIALRRVIDNARRALPPRVPSATH
jgi:hypothetical protein